MAPSATDARPALLLGGLVLVLVPAIFVGAGLAHHLRLVFTPLAVVVAVYLYTCDSRARYLGFCLWLFMLTPLIRRLADLHAGWLAVNPIMLAPYLALLPTALSLVRQIGRDDATRQWPFLVILASIAYGLLLAVLFGRVSSGIYDALRWALPPLLALFVLDHAAEIGRLRATVSTCLAWGLAVMGVYGLAQFVQPAPWDILWMRNVQMNSIGSPEPYLVRVFATMNSPGSLACWLTAGLVVVLSRSPGWRLLVAGPPGMAALLLSLSRIWWLAGLVCLLWLVWRGSGRLRLWLAGGLLAVLVALSFLLVTPEVERIVGDRIDSLLTLGDDSSASDRADQHAAFLLRLDEFVVGDGLATTGAVSSNLGEAAAVVVIDSGLIVTVRGLGVPVAAAYFVALLALLSRGLGNALRHRSDLVQCDMAIALGAVATVAGGSSHIGEQGIILWLFLAFASVPAAERSAGADPAARLRPVGDPSGLGTLRGALGR